MNNVTFGDESTGYYETVAGGAGAVSISTTPYTPLLLLLINSIYYISFTDSENSRHQWFISSL